MGDSRVVLLTGAAGGIGGAIAHALLAAGHSVAAVDRDAGRLASLGAPVFPVAADLSDVGECRDAVARVAAHFGRIDAVINNAGVGMSSIRGDAEVNLPGIEELSAEVWDRFYAVNIRGHIAVTQAALPHMRKGGFGRIVNNTTSFRSMLRVNPYGPLKAALEAMSAVWADELRSAGITVNVLIPGGPTDTPFISDAAGWDRAKMLSPTVMGPPAVWLISDEAAGYTGNRIIAANWDASLSGADAARKAGRAIGWPELGADAVWLRG
jgi:NAD(P)-dependent dehydrogenase (short-subunit alcohol dehydrogenase family)